MHTFLILRGSSGFLQRKPYRQQSRMESADLHGANSLNLAKVPDVYRSEERIFPQ